MSHRLITVCSVFLAILSLSQQAAGQQHSGNAVHNHASHSNSRNTPLQHGQATFAALIEIVALLESDPETDWRNVDIDALREHLLDMNRLMLDTTASKSILAETRIRFEIHGTLAAVPSIHRMTTAHARFISRSRGWSVEPVLNDRGAILTITADHPATVDRLYALGFYGFMSLDSHHQAHHYQMATGQSH